MWKKSCVLLTMVFGLAAQTDTAFTVGKIGVQLGEDQQTVLSTLRTAYEVHSVGEKTWVAGTTQGTHFDKAGVVSFENGKLVAAGTAWDESFDASAIQFAKQLIDVLKHQRLDSPRTAIVRAIHRSSDEAPVDGVEILLGDRTIQVVTSSALQGNKSTQEYAAVMETLHTPAFSAALKRAASSSQH